MKHRLLALVAAGALAVSLTPLAAAPAEAAPARYKNCTALNKAYKHGVGKKGAKDRVRGKTKPVTTFKIDTALYTANRHLDGDKDGVSCEKK